MLDKSILHLVDPNTQTVKEMMDVLKANYSATSTLFSFTKFRQYFAHHIIEGRSIAELEECGQPWKEIQDSSILTNTNLLKTFESMSALPESYNNVIEPILAVTKPADINYDDVRAKILNEYTRRDSGASVSAIRTPDNGKSKTLKFKCGFCRYSGHTKTECRKKKAASNNAKGTGKKEKKSNTTSTSSAAVHVVNAEGLAPEDFINVAAVFYGLGSTSWMIDSGCTQHITNNLNNFAEYYAFTTPSTATLADKQRTSLQTLGSGHVIETTHIRDKEITIQLDDVLYCPSMENRLLSVTCLLSKGFTVTFNPSGETVIQHANATYSIGTQKNGQFWLGIAPQAFVSAVSTRSSTFLDILHQRLEHLNWEALQRIQTDPSLVDSITISDVPHSTHLCEGCILGKLH